MVMMYFVIHTANIIFSNKEAVMKKVTVYVIGIVFLVLLGMPLYALEQGKEAAKVDPAKDLFEKKCSVCHKADRATSKKKKQKEWDTTVMRMINSHGAKINDGEVKIIIDYLTANYSKEEKK
jgi:hypothetical protein